MENVGEWEIVGSRKLMCALKRLTVAEFYHRQSMSVPNGARASGTWTWQSIIHLACRADK